MRGVLLLAVIAVSGCATSRPRLVNQEDAQIEFSKLGSGGRAIASQFYNLGAGDSIKRLYWSQRRAQESGATADAQPTVLQRKYVNIRVPEQVDPDGTVKEAHNQVIEVVQWLSVVTKHGHRIKLCN